MGIIIPAWMIFGFKVVVAIIIGWLAILGILLLVALKWRWYK